MKAVLAAKVRYYETDTKRDILHGSNTDSLYNGLLKKIAVMRAGPGSVSQQRYYVDKINAAITLDYRIQYSALERTPTVIIILLVVGSFLVGLLIGFTNGFSDHLQVLVPAIFFLLTTLTISAILDMDNPSFGIIRPSYNNYENMLQLIATDPNA